MFRGCNNEWQVVFGLALRLRAQGRGQSFSHPTDQYLHGAMQLEAGKRKAYLSPP